MRFASLRPAILLASLLALAGCSREPSAHDMEYAMGVLIQDTLDSLKHASGSRSARSGFESFDSFEKLGCRKLENNRGYECEFRYTGSLGGAINAGASTETAAARFYLTERGWGAEMGL